jgi:hypothetical protein
LLAARRNGPTGTIAQQAQQKIVQKDLLLCCWLTVVLMSPSGMGTWELCFVVVPVLKNYFYFIFWLGGQLGGGWSNAADHSRGDWVNIGRQYYVQAEWNYRPGNVRQVLGNWSCGRECCCFCEGEVWR